MATKVSMDLSQLYRLLTHMSESIHKVQEEGEKGMDRLDTLDRNVGLLAKLLSKVKSSDVDEVQDLVCKTKPETDEIRDLQLQMLRLERKFKNVATREDLDLNKQYLDEHAHKMKAHLVYSQSEMERRFDERLISDIEKFDQWQTDVTKSTTLRIDAMANEIKKAMTHIQQYRDETKKQFDKAQEETRNGFDQSKRQAAACSAQTQEVSSKVSQLIDRIEQLEQRVDRDCEAWEVRALAAEQSVTKLRIQVSEQKIDLDAEKKRSLNSIQKLERQLQAVEARLETKLNESTDRIDQESKETLARLDAFQSSSKNDIRIMDNSINEAITNLALTQEDRALAREAASTAFIQDLRLQHSENSCTIKRLDDGLSQLRLLVMDNPDKLSVLEEYIEDIRDANEARRQDELHALEQRLCKIEVNNEQSIFNVRAECEARLAESEATNSNRLAQLENRQDDYIDHKELERHQTTLTEKINQAQSIITDTSNRSQDQEIRLAELGQDVKAKFSALFKTQVRPGSKSEHSTSSLSPGTKSKSVRSHESLKTGTDHAPVNYRVSMARLDHKDQLKFQRNEASRIASACVQYEDTCIHKNYIVKFAHEHLSSVSASAMEMSAFISDKVNTWAVSQAVAENALEAGQCNQLNEDSLDEQRWIEQEAWIRLVKEEVIEIVATSDEISSEKAKQPLRIQARERFISKLSKALNICLSRHDSVVVMEHSGISTMNTDVPTCVACDRPLPKRQRGRRATESLSQHPDNTTKASSLAQQHRVNATTRARRVNGASLLRSSTSDKSETARHHATSSRGLPSTRSSVHPVKIEDTTTVIVEEPSALIGDDDVTSWEGEWN